MSKGQLNGTCSLCKATISKKEAQKHLQSCLQKTGKNTKVPGKPKPPVRLFHLTVEGYGLSGDLYWMHLKALGSATFRDLDMFLRDTWLECCGHMSAFFADEEEIDMHERLADVLEPGVRLPYEYDFGSTTGLLLTVISEFAGNVKKGKVEILARNEAPQIKCNQCQKPATIICTDCIYEDNQGWLCDDCARKHDCDEEMFLPVVNSPRTGVCAYAG